MSARTLRPVVLGFSVFVLSGLALVALSWHIIAATGYEGGDFAANSVLIQSAKHFRLTLGNYSRVGFNHPGPAILYVLAAGEALFHDALRWTTPIGGQIIAACFYNAAWIGLAAGLMRRMGFELLRVVVALSIVAAVMALREPHAFDNVWFPYLYALPFLAFTVALAAVFYGDRSAWVALAVSAGFLVNGHVSFAGICGVAVALALLAWAVRLRRLGAVWPLVGAVTFAAFLMPLVVRELHHRPGPVEEYLAFARGSDSHKLGEALRFVAGRVGASTFEVVAALVALAVLAARRGDPFARSIALATVAATLGTLYYALKGVDSFAFDYVLIYFGAVPALVLGIATASVLPWETPLWPVVASLASLSIWAAAIHGDPGMPDYDRPEVVKIDEALSRGAPERFRLDLVGSHDYAAIWIRVLGVEAKRLRERRPLGFCIGAGWNLSFTTSVRCGSADLDAPALVADVTGSTDDLAPPLFAAGGLDFFNTPKKCLIPGDRINPSLDGVPFMRALSDGWSPVGGGFAWSIGRAAVLDVCTDPSVKELDVDLQPFRWSGGMIQSATLSAGGPSVDVRFTPDRPEQRVAVPLPEGHPREVRVEIEVPSAISPAAVGLSPDPRALGVALYEIGAR